VKLQTGVPADTLKKQHDITGMTFGELLVGNSLAVGSGKSFSDILALKRTGQSWSEISKRLGINIDSITQRLKKAEESIKYAQSRRQQRRQQNVRDTIDQMGPAGRTTPDG
jgi:hypothetical protein